MIGNLFSAISIALMSSVFALGQFKADGDVVVGSSWVSGAETQVLLQSSFTHYVYRGNDLRNNIYNIDGEVIDGAEMPLNVDISDNTFWYKFLEEGMTWADYASYDVNSFPLITYRYSTPLSVNDKTYYFGMRFGISPLSDVNGFEFRSNANCTVYRYGVGLNGISYSYSYTYGGLPTQNAIGIYDVYSSLGRTDGTSVVGADTDLTPYNFIEYLVMFEQPVVGTGREAALIVDFQLINGTNDINFTNGYNNGYAQGSAEGYAKGYAEGLGVSHNSSFMGLFSSIADTPLRFIYGLFNFDLFGTSVLVIVLTLLTGIIVFGIVKKFWK